MDEGKQLQLQVKEKCGNRIVRVKLERIRVPASRQKANEICSSLKVCSETQITDLKNASCSRPSSEINTDRSRPQRNRKKIFTHYVSDGYGSDEDEKIKTDTSDSESGSSYNPKKRQKTLKNVTVENEDQNRSSRTSVLPPQKKLQTENSDTKITCHVCKINTTKSYIWRHLKRNHPTEILPRPKKSSSRKSFVTKSVSTIQCDFCPLVIPIITVWRHLQSEHPEELPNYDAPLIVKCDICPSVFLETDAQLHTHELTGHSRRKKLSKVVKPSFQCDLCSHKCKTKAWLENHILEVHVVDKPCECNICYKSFLTEELLTQHVKQAHEAKHFGCRYCPTKSFRDSASLKKHWEAAHKGYKELCDSEQSGSSSHMCPVCDTWFVTDSDLAKHLNKPKNKSVMKCEICSEPVHTACRLNLHRQKNHTEYPKADDSGRYNQQEGVVESADAMKGPHSEKITEISASVKNPVSSSNTFSCVVCSALFSRRCDLDLHELQENHRRWKCPICGKLSKWRNDLQIHIQSVHSDARPFSCTHKGCKSKFPVMKLLKMHMATHATDRVHCKQCSRYLTLKRFKAHVANYHGKKDQFKCHVCNSMWPTQKRLEIHAVNHTDERPWPCKFCVATYKLESESNRHMQKCEFRSKEQRKQFLQERNRGLLAAEVRKCKSSRKKFTGKGKAEKLQGALTSKTKVKSNSTNEIGDNNGAELKFTKQEMDPKCGSDNFITHELPVTGLVEVKFEKVPKRENTSD